MFDAHDPLTRDAAFIVVVPFIVAAPVTPNVDDNVVAPDTPSVDDNDVAPVTPNVFRIVTASFAVNVDDNAVGINDTNSPSANVVIASDTHERDSTTPPSAVTRATNASMYYSKPTIVVFSIVATPVTFAVPLIRTPVAVCS